LPLLTFPTPWPDSDFKPHARQDLKDLADVRSHFSIFEIREKPVAYIAQRSRIREGQTIRLSFVSHHPPYVAR